MSENQCDGCSAGYPLSVDGTHTVPYPSGPMKCQREKYAAREWKRAHYQDFIFAVWDCDDVQTLRALAHRLGYKEGT